MKFFRAATIIVIFTLGCTIPDSLAQLPDMRFETITSKDGLPSNTVHTAMKDHQGFMWFGTRLCPVRYDGGTFLSFRNPKTNFVTGIAEDRENTIWMSSDKGGICKIEAHSLEMKSIQKNAAGTTGDFYIDKKGHGWYSDFKGVNKLNLKTGAVVHYPFRQTLFLWNKASFVEDNNNTLWVIGRDNGLFRYDAALDTMICVLGKDSSDPHKNDSILFSKGCVDQRGILWIGSFNRGLIRYDPVSDAYEEIPTGRISNQVKDVIEGWDDEGKRILWIGDDQGLGIFRVEQNKFYFFQNVFPESFEVNDLFRDPTHGIVWACTSEGIVKYHPKSNMIKTVAIPPDIVSFPVTVKCFLLDNQDPSGNTYYLGLSHTGILKWNAITNEFILIRYPASSAETCWLMQRDGKIWAGTNRWDYTRPGIFVYDPSNRRFISTPLSVLANQYFSVPFFMYGLFDKKGRLWIGNSDEGIHLLDEISARDITPWDKKTQQALLRGNNLINDICIDRYGRLFLGTYKGIYYGNEKNGSFIKVDSSKVPIPYPTVNSLLEDTNGDIWAARWGSITRNLPNGKLKTFLANDDGFYDHENRGLVQDYRGNIWIGNYEGIYCFNPVTKNLVRFTVNDGLINNNTTRGLMISHNRKQLLIGQKNGFNIIRIDQLLTSHQASRLVISSFKIHNKLFNADFSSPIRLKRTDNAFNVDFIALNYRKQHDNHYAYFLEGLEKNWNYSGTNHLAYYTNLDPGKYKLHVKTSDSFGNWNKNELSLLIHVSPAFYETWWFKSLMITLVLALLYGLYQYRINQLLRLQRVRNRISADLHDELGASLSGISIMGTLAQKNMQEQHPSTPFILRIVEEVQQISSSLDDIVWNISPKNDELISLIARMTRYSSELFEARQIRYHFKMPESVEHVRLSMEQRRNFYLIFKESVNNLVKYSQCQEAFIGVEIIHKNLVLFVKDDGIGFEIDKRSDRNGIRNMKERSKKLNGKLEITSALNKGTTIHLIFPMKKP